MKTLEEVINNYNNYRVKLDDRFGTRFCNFLTPEQALKIGFKFKDPKSVTPKEWTRENILEQLKCDVAFGFEKALNMRGISSSLMFYTVLSWNKILEEGLEDYSDKDYACYGLPLFKTTAVKYGFDNPIGDDEGSEDKYNDN